MNNETDPNQPVARETLCGHPLANGKHTCQRPLGHDGIHYPGVPAAEHSSPANRDRTSDPAIDLGVHWIETTCHRDRSATNWLIKRGSEILKVGEVRDDPTGNRAFDAASTWASINVPGVNFNWKHWSETSEPDGD